MAGIFINYRRDDAAGVAGRLFDHLALKYPRRNLFMDVDAMKPGVDFAQQLDAQVSQCRVLLAVIGPHWLEAKDQNGRRRLDSDSDYVRIELASALKRDIPVIPVLVDGATMPPEERLTEDLKPLARRHAVELRHTRFNADAEAITRALEMVVPRRHTPWGLVAAGLVLVSGAIALAVLWPNLVAKLHGAAPPTVVAANPTSAPDAGTVAPPPAGSSPASPSQMTVAAALGSAAPSGLPPGVKLGEMMTAVAFPGSNLRVVNIAPDIALCQSTCRAETRCAVWTFTRSLSSTQPAHCALKTVVPAPVPNSCCTSAIERAPPSEMRVPPPIPAGVTGALPGIELEGGTYMFFAGNRATPQKCQAACRADGKCIAWDYVRPGVLADDARCFLKDKASAQVASPCCIAGFEHQAGPPTPPAAPSSGER